MGRPIYMLERTIVDCNYFDIKYGYLTTGIPLRAVVRLGEGDGPSESFKEKLRSRLALQPLATPPSHGPVIESRGIWFLYLLIHSPFKTLLSGARRRGCLRRSRYMRRHGIEWHLSTRNDASFSIKYTTQPLSASATRSSECGCEPMKSRTTIHPNSNLLLD